MQTQHARSFPVLGFGLIVEALHRMGWRAHEDAHLVVTAGSGSFVQVARVNRQSYLAEWSGPYDLVRPELGLHRAQCTAERGRLREKGNFPLYQADLIPFAMAADILLDFWLGRPRSPEIHWRCLHESVRRASADRHPFAVN